MLYNEERPQNFDQVKGQKHIVEAIRKQSIADKWFNVYIFAGQFGSGKTTMARIVAMTVNCKHKDAYGNPCLTCENCKSIIEEKTTDIMEIDGASNTGIDSIRELKDNTKYSPVNLLKKIYIIDEVHMLSKNAFNALLKVLEEPPKHAMFILCTTELAEIPLTVRSRAAGYNFEQITFDEIYLHLKEVSNKHSLKITNDALALIAKNSQGSMRNALSLLDQVTSGNGNKVDAADVNHMLGISDITYLFELLKNIIMAKPAECISLVENASSKGKDLSLMIKDLLDIVTDCVVAKSSSVNKIHNTEQYLELLENIVDLTYVEQLCQIADGLMNIRVDMHKSPSKATVVVGIIRITTTTINLSLIKRIEDLERALRNGVALKELQVEDNNFKETAKITVDVSEEIVSEPINGSDMTQGQEIDPKRGADLDPIKEEYNTGAALIKEEKDDFDTNSAGNIPESDVREVLKEDVSDNKPENLMKYSSGEQPINIDILSIFEQFSISGNSNIMSVNTLEANVDAYPNEEIERNRLEERLRLVSANDAKFVTSLQGCVKTMKNGNLILMTPLKPVYEIIKTYLSVTEIKEILVEHDPMISLN